MLQNVAPDQALLCLPLNQQFLDTSSESKMAVLLLQFFFTLVLLNPDIPYLCKQCRSISVGFWRSQLIWICTVYHQVCEFDLTILIKQSDWLECRSGCGFLIYSAWQGLIQSLQLCHFVLFCDIVYCHHLFLISSSLGSSGSLYFLTVAYPG